MTTVSESLDRPRFYINGEWARPHGQERLQAIEAATEQPLGFAAVGDAADVDAAVTAGRSALDHGPWSTSTPHERAAFMLRFADGLAARAEFTCRLVSRENGMPITLSTGFNSTAPVGILRMYADLATRLAFESVRPSAAGSTVVRREPVGVVGAIAAWNYPQMLAMMKIAPALAAGCTVVLKPSPETALDAYVLADAALEAGLPPGVLNVVLGGPEAGAALVTHPDVDKIAFTGSTATGRWIAAECGRLIRRATLELGGKSASIVLDDADVATFVAGLASASFRNNSQTCTTQSRILVARSRYAEVVDAVADFARGMVVGDPLDPAVTCGPMASEQHLARVQGYVAAGLRSDARLVVGGGAPAGLHRGWFIEPTVFADVDNRDRIAREEIFGPVIAVMPFDDDDEAVSIANDSDYGLGGSVWTADEQRGIGVARRIRTGTIGVNYYSIDTGSPFGGMKASGLGRELGPEGLDNYLEYKSIYASSALLTAG